MNNPTFQEQIQDLWRTRPVRLPAQGHVAGVCAGIGYRYGIDPILVRVAFVASTIFGGSGILLYLAGWLVLARAGDGSSPAQSLMGRGHSSDSSTKTIVLLVALAIAATTVVTNPPVAAQEVKSFAPRVDRGRVGSAFRTSISKESSAWFKVMETSPNFSSLARA